MSNTDDTKPPSDATDEATPNARRRVEVADLIVHVQKALDVGFLAVRAEVKEARDETKADFLLLGGQFEALETDVRGMQSWRVRVDDRLRNNSIRAQATSSVDLEQDAKHAQTLIQLAEEKAKTAALEANGATKEDVKTMLAAAAETQTSAIVTAVETLVKTPTMQKLKGAIVPVLMIAISIIGIKLTMLLTKLQAATPASQTTTVQIQSAPITDAGADR